MDASSGMLAIARANLREAQFVLADFESFTFPDNIDIIFAFASLLHVNRREFQSILERSHVVLKPGGLFFISLKHGAYRRYNQHDEVGIRTYYFYDLPTLTEMIGDSYEVVEEKTKELGGQLWLDVLMRRL